MKLKRRLWTVVLSVALLFTSTGVVSFANDTEDAAVDDQQSITVEAQEESIDEIELPDIPEEATPEDAEVQEESPERPLAESETPETPAAAEATNTANVLSYSAAGINSKVKKSLKNYRSVLIAGIDDGGRADLMIVYSYNTKTKKARVFTVARDTYMQLNDKATYNVHGKKRAFCKCNQAADYGGLETLVRELNRHLDLNIREYIAIDWEGTAALIDTLGGLEANVKNESMRDGINNLLPSNNKIKKTGKQTLNGWQAVQYLRVRHYYESSSDKKKGVEAGARVREDRNRDVFVQLYNKARKMSYSKVISVYNAISDQLVTNMNVADALKLVADTAKIKKAAVTKTPGFPYKATNYWDPDGYYVYFVMLTNASNVKTLHSKMFGQKNYKLSSTAAKLDKKTKTLIKKYLKKDKPTFKKAKVKISGTEYTGSPVTPVVTVKLGDRVLFGDGEDYKNAGLKARTAIGKYSFVVKGCGAAYSGQKKKATYTINPKGTDGLNLIAVKRGFKASWDEQAELMPDKHITGYQIQYCLKKNFSGAKTITVKGYNKTGKTIKRLTGKKTYYVRVRTYVKIGKSTYCSKWTATKKIKTK